MKKMTFHLIALLLAAICLLTLSLTNCTDYEETTKKPSSSTDNDITPIGRRSSSVEYLDKEGNVDQNYYAIDATIIDIAKDRSWYTCYYNTYRVIVNENLPEQGYYDIGAIIEITYHIDDLSISEDGKSYIIAKVAHLCIEQAPGGEVYDKPVIYLYPEVPTTVDVRVDFKGAFTVTIPEYRDGWTVTAHPDGRLITEDGEQYPYLFWEGIPASDVLTLTEGFCVRGEQTEAFLLDILPRLGLIESEYTEFIDFWLPRMQDNAYNVIRFNDPAYIEMATMDVAPAPDTIIRVFMSYAASNTYVELPTQHLTTPTRNGFTVVEWGGCELP